MSLETIARIIHETRERVIAQGVDRAVVDAALMRAEAEMVAAEIERMKQFRDLVKQCGTRAIAERRGVSPSTIRRQLNAALNEITQKKAA